MTFKNEYVPSVEQETSEFFRNARDILRISSSQFNRWTIDREREIILYRRGGGGHEDPTTDYWSFLNADGEHQIVTEELERSPVSPDEIAVTLSLGLRGDLDRYTNEVLICIKEAFSEYTRWHLFNPEAFKHCQLKLILRSTSQEL